MKEVDPNMPIDKIAALVVSKPSEAVVRFSPSQSISSLSPLPTVQFTGPKIHDLTGKKCGAYTVVGFAAWRSKDKQNATRWVVRCKCGRYQLLTTKAVKKNHPDTMCVECVKTRKLRFRHINKSTYEHP